MKLYRKTELSKLYYDVKELITEKGRDILARTLKSAREHRLDYLESYLMVG